MASIGEKTTKFYEATGPSSIKDARPGTNMIPNPLLYFEGLGNVDDFPEIIDVKDEEGVGTHCVVLSDILSGAEGVTYVKGQVHRLSKLVPNYNNPDRDKVKSTVRRLVQLGAIRHATTEEIAVGQANVTVESEGGVASEERAKRIQAEAENADLRKKLAAITGTGTDIATDAVVTPAADPFGED